MAGGVLPGLPWQAQAGTLFVLEGGPKTKKGCCVLGDRSVTSHRREGVRDDCLAPEEQVPRGDLGARLKALLARRGGTCL